MTRYATLKLVGAIAVLLAACAPATATQPIDLATAPAEPLAPTTVAQATPAPTGEAPGSGGNGATPTARGGLEATDPASVVIGKGKPVFLEFFAFW